MPTTPLMGLPISIIGVDTGLTWEQNLNSALNRIDQHNHTSGNGNQVLPGGININSDLSFQTQNATDLRTARFIPQSMPITAAAPDQNCIYVCVSGGNNELFYNDSEGNQVQLTAGGLVNATASGISSGTASALFISNVLVVNADTNTPANIQGASLLLGNNVANSKYLTLSPPAAMAADYTLTLPVLPGALSFVSLDTSGNFGVSVAVAGGITASNIAAGTITTTQIAAATVRDSNLAILKPSSSSNSSYSNSTATFTTVGFSSALTVIGGQVVGMLFNGNITIQCLNPFTVNGQAAIRIERNGTVISNSTVDLGVNTNAMAIPIGALNFMDTPGAGTHTYTVFIAAIGGQTTVTVAAGAVLRVFEI